MKKIYPSLLIVFLCISFYTKAQVNYLLNTSQSVYTNLENGNHPALDNPTPVGYYEDDEGFANDIPIGFSFTYNNKNYTHLNINVNGFVTFGAGFTMDVGTRYNTNNLKAGPKQNDDLALIAPLWDDLRLLNNNGLSYATKGTAPNRIFIVQWDSASWHYNLLEPAISFQMLLFEGTNKIQFIYKSLNGSAANAKASVGITTCTKCTDNFLSLNSISNNTGLSGVKEYNNINTKPITGTLIEFEPGKSEMPTDVLVDAYNSNEMKIVWNTTIVANYDYAITKSPLQPTTFATTNNKTISLKNLEAGTQYYVHIRTATSAGKSGWYSIPAKTASKTVLPYTQQFESVASPNIPDDFAIANPSGGNAWKTIALSSTPPYNKAISYKGDGIKNADAWFILPAMQLDGGLTYKLQFKYRISDSLGGNQKVEIKLGKMINNGMIAWQTIYKNYKINQLKFKDTSMLFSAPTDDIYFIAFRCVSEKSNTSVWIDEINVNKIKPLPVKLLSFTGIKENNVNNISWQTTAEYQSKSFELQRSSDGINFTSIKEIPTKAINGVSTVTLNYSVTDLTPNLIDYYRLKVTDKDGNESFIQNILRIAGQLPFQIKVYKTYPNPASNVINTIVYAPYNTKGIYQIMDSYGKILITIPITVIAGDNILQADVSKLGRGMYYAKVICNIGGETNAKAFIKQ